MCDQNEASATVLHLGNPEPLFSVGNMGTYYVGVISGLYSFIPYYELVRRLLLKDDRQGWRDKGKIVV